MYFFVNNEIILKRLVLIYIGCFRVLVGFNNKRTLKPSGIIYHLNYTNDFCILVHVFVFEVCFVFTKYIGSGATYNLYRVFVANFIMFVFCCADCYLKHFTSVTVEIRVLTCRDIHVLAGISFPDYVISLLDPFLIHTVHDLPNLGRVQVLQEIVA